MDAYTYQATNLQRIIEYKSTEPALASTFEAKRERDSRQEIFDSSFKINQGKEDYLESIKKELRHRSRAFKFQIFEIGKLVYEAKKNLPHGEFKPWIEENFDHGYRTAYNCMTVFLTCMGHPEIVEYFNPSCLYLIAKPSFPDDLRTALLDGVKGPVDIKKKDLIQLSMRIKNNEISVEDKEVQALLVKDRSSTILDRCEIELKSMGKIITQRQERIRSILNTYSPNPLIDDYDLNDILEEKQENIETGFRLILSQVSLMIDEVKS